MSPRALKWRMLESGIYEEESGRFRIEGRLLGGARRRDWVLYERRRTNVMAWVRVGTPERDTLEAAKTMARNRLAKEAWEAVRDSEAVQLDTAIARAQERRHFPELA